MKIEITDLEKYHLKILLTLELEEYKEHGQEYLVFLNGMMKKLEVEE